MGKQSKARHARKRQGGGRAGRGDDNDADLLAQLDLLARRRAPYGDLLAAIVAETLHRFPLGLSVGVGVGGGGGGGGGGGVVGGGGGGGGVDVIDRVGASPAILEIGAGTGELRARLAPELAARAVHTDPSRGALTRLLGRAGDERVATAHDATTTRVATARAQSLPFVDRAFAGVLGLCVFDAIHATGADAAAVAEIARVLAPGGRFVHLLDMVTLLEAPFAKLAAGGLVPIPNVFGDPADHEWPLDILLLRRDWLAGLLELAARARHPLATEFAEFFQSFLGPPISFDAGAAADLFKALASDGDQRFSLSNLIASACQLAVQQGYPTLQPLPFHSGRYLASVLDAAFKDSGAFRVERSEIVTRSTWRARDDAHGDRAAPAYRGLALGHERVLGQLPVRLLDESARAQAARALAGDTLVELGAHVFVATRR